MQTRSKFMRLARISSVICSTLVRRTMIGRMQIFNAADDSLDFQAFVITTYKKIVFLIFVAWHGV
jgi:hypothetical protein